MSSPFSKLFSAKNPIRQENSNVEEPKNLKYQMLKELEYQTNNIML